MISSPDFVSRSSDANSSTMQKILQIREEIGMIAMHEREHVNANGKVLKLEESCQYCRRRSTNDELKIIDNPAKKSAGSTLYELERTAEVFGKNAHVLVPKSWAGRRVKIVLVVE